MMVLLVVDSSHGWFGEGNSPCTLFDAATPGISCIISSPPHVGKSSKSLKG